ncbi:lysophospholipid acyltransferase family protein [Salinarimonas soli]|uniref:1-acyl-sn-glycerol-3-phosphate acyltransferase n=1 Tax=Salinarimonas soli TaxID=1638099 RepID=A0A5B2VF40_9HYPH|nr:lysophospholipid acyltransferase family protein [Salinarimonas soli]KAA2236817.1 1-acyl-sn-glycerol-3-phosphate acyltransferase [Salinarimonas soli]
MRLVRLGLTGLVLLAYLALALPVQLVAVRAGWRIAAWIPVIFHRLTLWLLDVRVTSIGTPPDGEPSLVLANHSSWLDIVVIGSLRPLAFVAKSEIAGWPVIGLFADLQRTVYIERARRSHTAEVNETVARRLARGEIVVLFPEGTTNDGNRLLPFRSSLVGAAGAVLTETGAGSVRLQPLSVAFTRRNGLPVTRRERPAIAWYGSMELAPHLKAFLSDGPLDVEATWGEPILFDHTLDRKRAAALAEAAVREGVKRSLSGANRLSGGAGAGRR